MRAANESKEARQLRLRPGQTGGFPAVNGAAFLFIVERTFETLRDIKAKLLSRLGQGDRRRARTNARTT